jgi:hypothetical protein
MLFLNICKVEVSIVDQAHSIAQSCNANMDEIHCWPMFFARGGHFLFFNNLRAAEYRVHLNNLR